MWVVILHYVVAVNLLLTLIEHPTASLTPDCLCPYPAVVCWASVHLSACLSVTFVSVSARAKLLLPRLSFDILFFPSFLLSPQSHYLSLFPVLPSHWWYVCQLPPVLEHLSPTSPPSIYLDAIFMRSGSHPALLSGCTWTLLTNCLFFSCASALFSSSSLLLLPPGCTAGKQCFSSFFLHCAFL